MNFRTIGIVAIFVLLLYLGLSFGIYNTLSKNMLGANDFYSRWVCARALVLRGENPYSDAVTREIQLGMYGHLVRPDEDQVAFAYPLYAAFIALPFIAFDYSQAQAMWMALLILLATIGVLFLARLNSISLSPIILGLFLLGTLAFYPAVRAIFMGQYALVSFFFIVLACLAVQKQFDWAAGIFLAVSTMKPQPVILLVPVIVLWAVYQRRWRIAVGAVGGMIVLIGLSLLLLPTWVFDFVQAIRKYAEYEPVGPPVQILFELWLPDMFRLPMTLLFGALLLSWVIWQVAHLLRRSWSDFLPALSLVAIVSTWINGRMGSSDQVLLFIPWGVWLGDWIARRQIAAAVILSVLFIVLPWMVFLATVRGNAEHVVVSLVLPMLMLVMYLGHPLVGQKNKTHE